jgi:N-methylhydantoinase B
MFEQMTPHRLLEHEFLIDSAGPGRQRGGLGVVTRYLVGGEGTKIVTFGDGDVEPSFGLFGGGSGTLNRIELQRPDGKVVRPASKDIVDDVPAGTIYLQDAGGGGGYGPPHERPADKVAREVRDGIISPSAARDHYGVAVDPVSFELDAAETARLRKREPA